MGTNSSRPRPPAGARDASAQGEQAACLRAAIRLHWRAAGLADVTSAGVVRAVSELLDVIGIATGADPAAVPASVRRAALRLAEQVDHVRLAPTPQPSRRSSDSSSPFPMQRRADAGDIADADRLRLPTQDGA